MKVKLTERSYHCLNPSAEKQSRSQMHSPFSKVHIPKGHDIEPLAKTNTENARKVDRVVRDYEFAGNQHGDESQEIPGYRSVS